MYNPTKNVENWYIDLYFMEYKILYLYQFIIKSYAYNSKKY